MSTQPITAPTGRSSSPGVERLDCYRLALELSRLAPSLVPRGHAALRDQLERASSSALLNLAEGYARWQKREKAHLYDIARGSALESAAAIDLLRVRGLADAAVCSRARELASRVALMLGGLMRSAEGRRR